MGDEVRTFTRDRLAHASGRELLGVLLVQLLRTMPPLCFPQPGKTHDLSREPLLSMSVSHPNVVATHKVRDGAAELPAADAMLLCWWLGGAVLQLLLRCDATTACRASCKCPNASPS